jgi:LacI family transcriptional regulator
MMGKLISFRKLDYFVVSYAWFELIPNRHNVRSLRQIVRRRVKAKKNVLVLLGWVSPETSKEISRFAHDADWHIDERLFYTHEVPMGWCGDGLIATFGARDDLNHFICRQAPLQPTVILGGNNGGLSAPTVHVDNYAVGCLAARHLLERNHRTFAWYSANHGDVATDRCKGFTETLRSLGFKCRMLNYDSDEDSTNWSCRRRWLANRLRALPRPLALFALDDTLASEAIEVCREKGWNIPEEISVVGVGNLDIAKGHAPIPITSVDTREAESAWQAAAMLKEMMNRKPVPTKVILPPGPLVVRQSSDTLAANHPAIGRAIQYMKKNISKSFGAETIAEATGVSRRVLYELFARELSTTPTAILASFRLDHARTLLLHSDEAVATIAKRCGFGTHRTFDRAFLKVERCTPAAWREKNGASSVTSIKREVHGRKSHSFSR